MPQNTPHPPPYKAPRQKRYCFEHEYERRGFRNGCGICKYCEKFFVGVFEPLERCCVCNCATYYTYGTDVVDGMKYWYCKDHQKLRPRDTRPNECDAYAIFEHMGSSA